MMWTRSREENLTKLTIKDIPLSLSDDVIRAEQEAKKYEVKGTIVRQKVEGYNIIITDSS